MLDFRGLFNLDPQAINFFAQATLYLHLRCFLIIPFTSYLRVSCLFAEVSLSQAMPSCPLPLQNHTWDTESQISYSPMQASSNSVFCSRVNPSGPTLSACSWVSAGVVQITSCLTTPVQDALSHFYTHPSNNTQPSTQWALETKHPGGRMTTELQGEERFELPFKRWVWKD